jgi:hypothetical protein
MSRFLLSTARAVISAFALACVVLLVTPLAAHAAPPVSQSEGRLVLANLLGAPSTQVAALAGASAIDPLGTGGPFTSDVPLDAVALQALNLQASAVDLFGAGGIIQLGAVGQYAQARDDGSSVAFSGTVSSAPSLVGVGTSPTGGNLGAPGGGNSALIAIGDPVTSPASISASIGVLAASAQETAAGVQSGDYAIANLDIAVGGTLVSTAVTPVAGILDTLLAVVNPLIGTPIADPLAGGQVTVSLADLLAAAGVADITDLPPGTDLLSFLPDAVVAKVATLTNATLDAVTTAIAGLALPLDIVTATIAQDAANAALALLTPLTAGPLVLAVTALAQLTVNNQSLTNGAFTENALTVGVGPAGAIASVALASATVGPNAPASPGGGGNVSGTSTTAALAATGVDVTSGMLAATGLLALGNILIIGTVRRRDRREAEPQPRV